ncbi:hypothetical protein QVD17_32628 [Tagetes erecta]|uniref:Uncharacterized protein n=1 Tax=Tagetes erecta TaxID=13708 RepID=A0AAD8JXM2_TARER|nr:hypothetical protein QVD17_32628 [Tagetes erecta]
MFPLESKYLVGLLPFILELELELVVDTNLLLDFVNKVKSFKFDKSLSVSCCQQILDPGRITRSWNFKRP